MDISDLEAVLAIERKVFQDPWSETSFIFEICNNPHARPMVLTFMDTVIGYSVVWMIFEAMHIATIAVDPAHQNEGWGKYLIRQLLKIATPETEFAMLEVRPSNATALRLYASFGFRIIGQRNRYYRDGEDAYIMRLDLD